MSDLKMFFLGSPLIERGGAPLHFGSRKITAMVAFLAMSEDWHRRETLITLLWPELDPSRGRAGLRRNLSHLRKALDGEWLLVEGDRIGVDPDCDLTIDVHEFRRLISDFKKHGHQESGLCAQCMTTHALAVEQYRGDFLEGFSLRDSSSFDEWQFFQTEGLRQELALALERLVRGFSAHCSYEEAIPYARQWLALDPLHEPAHRQLMILYSGANQRAAALRQYKECERQLQEELGLQPDRETVRLLEFIKKSQAGDYQSMMTTPRRMSATPGMDEYKDRPRKVHSELDRIRRGKFVGRELELSHSAELWDRSTTANGQMLFISGEPGIGKTRLIRELSAHVQRMGGLALVGGCYAEGGIPYAPFTQLIRQGFEAFSDEEPVIPDSVLADLVSLAPSLQFRNPSVQTRSEFEDPKSEKQRLFDSFVFFLSSLSNRAPLLLTVEDIHWADSGTLSLLRHLARNMRQQPIMIVVTSRDVSTEEAKLLHEMLLDLNREHLVDHMRLSRLNREVTELLLSILFAEEITPEFAEGIYEETEGNPFYIEEVCKALIESGKLNYVEGRWSRPSMEEVGIPQSIQVAIQSRMRVLPEEAQDVLLTAAILGREFGLETLIEVSDQEEDTIVEALEDAIRAQLVVQLDSGAGGLFTFVHALIPATLVDLIRILRRRRLHGRAAKAVELLDPHNYELLAYHYSQSGEQEKTAHYLILVGDRARKMYAQPEAITSYQQALEMLEKTEDLEQIARTYMKLGLTYHNAFNYDQSRLAYQQGLALWQQVSRVAVTDLVAPHALRISTLEPAGFGPGIVMDLPSAVFQDQLFSGLVEVGRDMNLLPDASSSWDILDSGCRYVFHLRNDVLWSDGVQVTAEDFEFAWKRVLNPGRAWPAAALLFDVKNAHAYNQGELSDVELVGVKATAKLTLTVDLEGPTNFLPYLFAFSPLFPIPRHTIKRFGERWDKPEHLVTNGPFRLAEYKPAHSLALVRNKTFHGQFSGNLQRVECSFHSNDPGILLQLYEQDRLDIGGELSPEEWIGARHRYAGEYISGPRLSIDCLGFDLSRPPFDLIQVRQAFAMATDRAYLANIALSGYATPATGGFVPPGMPGHSPGISLPYDPENARQLLAEAGYPGGAGLPELVCITRDDPGHDLLCDSLRSQWLENLGVEVRWRGIEWGSFSSALVKESPHIWIAGWFADYPDPDDYLRTFFWLSPSWNPEYRRLINGARRMVNQGERMDLYRQADQILSREVPVIPLTYLRFHMLVKPWVKRFSTTPLKWWYWKDVVLEPHQ